MDHSVRAYLERIPIEKLHSVLEKDFIKNTDASSEVILQDVLEALITRNKAEDGLWTEYIYQIQAKQKQSV